MVYSVIQAVNTDSHGSTEKPGVGKLNEIFLEEIMKLLKSIKSNKNQNGCTNASAKLDFKVTFFISFTNLPFSFLSLVFQEPGTTLEMTMDVGRHTQFLLKLARSCISQ